MSYESNLQDFNSFDKTNPHVWNLFEKFALQAVESGKTKLSHWLIVNRIRWETNVVTTGSDFKISNNFIAFYARKWNKTHPQHKSLFTTKRMVGESQD